MAKGQKRSTREAKKPKSKPSKEKPANPHSAFSTPPGGNRPAKKT